jgi:hypothetical protein
MSLSKKTILNNTKFDYDDDDVQKYLGSGFTYNFHLGKIVAILKK